MTLTLDLPDNIEAVLQAEAARQGVEPQQIVMDALVQRLRDSSTPAPRLEREEATLLQQINLGFSPQWWEQYEALKRKRRTETLPVEEQAQLVQMSDQLEQANARRMRCLVELAQLRNTALQRLMRDLGLLPASHG